MDNLIIILKDAGLTLADVVTARVFLTNFERDYEKMNATYRSYFKPGHLPARTCIGVTALARGVPPSQRYLDAPIVVDAGGGAKWRPGNYEGTFNGPVPMRVALEKSLNLVTVRIAQPGGQESLNVAAAAAICLHASATMTL